jgi:hypothetical protein
MRKESAVEWLRHTTKAVWLTSVWTRFPFQTASSSDDQFNAVAFLLIKSDNFPCGCSRRKTFSPGWSQIYLRSCAVMKAMRRRICISIRLGTWLRSMKSAGGRTPCINGFRELRAGTMLVWVLSVSDGTVVMYAVSGAQTQFFIGGRGCWPGGYA